MPGSNLNHRWPSALMLSPANRGRKRPRYRLRRGEDVRSPGRRVPFVLREIEGRTGASSSGKLLVLDRGDFHEEKQSEFDRRRGFLASPLQPPPRLESLGYVEE